jgi:hypothetical protein
MRIDVTVKRPNGQIEVVDMSAKLGTMNDALLKKVRKMTQEGGRGYVMKAVVTRETSNMQELVRDYKNLHNEGGFGYLPNDDYFRSLPSYKEWTETKTYL